MVTRTTRTILHTSITKELAMLAMKTVKTIRLSNNGQRETSNRGSSMLMMMTRRLRRKMARMSPGHLPRTATRMTLPTRPGSCGTHKHSISLESNNIIRGKSRIRGAEALITLRWWMKMIVTLLGRLISTLAVGNHLQCAPQLYPLPTITTMETTTTAVAVILGL